MKKNFRGFTLIEIMIWVSISIVLMIWVWIFVSSWIKNITIQKQILEQNSLFSQTLQNFENIFSPWFEIISLSNSWVLVKSNFFLWKGNFYDIWIKTQTLECENDPDIETKYLSIKSFNPFIFDSEIYSWKYIKNWNQISLNNFSSNTSSWGIHFISDFSNNRIFYLEGWEAKNLLDINDGIYKPTWILYDDWNLYILNNFWKELLVFSSKFQTAPTSIDINFRPLQDLTGTGKLRFTFFTWSLIVRSNWPTSTWSFTFSWFSLWVWDNISFTPSWTLDYNFSWSTRNFLSWSNYWIKIDNLSWNFDNIWNYYLRLHIHITSWTWTFYFPFFTNWDNNLFTLDDNTLQTLTWWLEWNFSQITLDWNDLFLSDFVSWKYIKLSNTWSFISSWTLLSIQDFENTKENFIKIKDFKANISWNLLTLKIDYYKNFSCYDEGKNVVKTILFKKSIK